MMPNDDGAWNALVSWWDPAPMSQRRIGDGAPGSGQLWICPACGARLVTRNLSHSCGQWSLETLFAAATPSALALARTYVAMLQSLGDVQVLPQRTRLVAVAQVRFAGLAPRKAGFLANFALHRWVNSPRIAKTEDYGPRWRFHHLQIGSAADLDDELRGWLQESHDVVGLRRGLDPVGHHPGAQEPTGRADPW